MSFLQPWLLAALPLAALPIVIHLIHQRRFRTVRWAAMMFLLAAARMSRGYARLRQWLILLFRALAVATLVFAISRPLASGWIGSAIGDAADTTLVLIDLSPSMSQREDGSSLSKLETARKQLAELLGRTRSTKWVVIDGARGVPREIANPGELAEGPLLDGTSRPSDFPTLLQAARDYIATNRAGRTEIWICSDTRANDWDADSPRWATLRSAFGEFTQSIRFHLVAYPRVDSGNLAIRVGNVRRRATSDGAELTLSIHVAREPGQAGNDGPRTIPVRMEIDGAPSVLPIDLVADRADWLDYRVPLPSDRKTGWGVVRLPEDSNPADNEFFFVYDEPAPRAMLVVAEDIDAVRHAELAASISPDRSIACAVERVERERVAGVAWETVSLVLWQGVLPSPSESERIDAFLARGGRIVFLPPRGSDAATFRGMRWGSWHESPPGTLVESWRTDQDLLANTSDGAALPVGSLRIARYRDLAGTPSPLATLRGGAPLLARAPTESGGVYFLATTPSPADSSLAADGVVLYIALHRALAAGAESLGNARQRDAGFTLSSDSEPWTRLAGSRPVLSTDYPLHAGVYQTGDASTAVNRPLGEDLAGVLPEPRVAELFRGLDFTRVDDRAGSGRSLIQEIWRLFLTSMVVAMVVEAALCMPKGRRGEGGST
ncbi:MAG: hypothetical protein FJ297_06305 [Planctomycetes bacterium]|nr:hypothetical protein [Planctomycetota bacterium]